MSNTMKIRPGTDPGSRERFLALLDAALREDTFVKLTLGKYRGKEPELERIYVKRIAVKGTEALSFVRRYRTRDVTQNLPTDEGREHVAALLGNEFRSGHLFTTEHDAQIEFSKKGKTLLRQSRSSHSTVPKQSHDRTKERLIDPAAPFLRELGITDSEGAIIPAMARKWKQINKFVEIFAHALDSARMSEAIHVVDFGSGKGYLTFGVHHYLATRGGGTGDASEPASNVTGVELRPELVAFCNDAVGRLGLDGLEFIEGDIGSYDPEKIDVMIALHACDIATDLAIHKGISAGARVIMCAPCCHKELRPQMHLPEALRPMLRHGVHLGQESDMVTDSLRALLMEAHGYTTGIFEFVSLEHTSKNKMILGIRKEGNGIDSEALDRVRAIKEFYGIQSQKLETLLAADQA